MVQAVSMSRTPDVIQLHRKTVNNSGFSLLEILITLVLFTAGVIGIMWAFTGGMYASADIEENELKELVLQDEKVARWIGDRPVKKFFVVANKLVNVVL